MNALCTALCAALALAAAPGAPARAEEPARLALVVRDAAALRAAPRDAAREQALLWQGAVVEVRGERLDYLQVWDYQRERGGFLRAADVRLIDAQDGGAALLPVLRFVRDTPGAEALGIGLAAAYVRAAPAQALAGAPGADVFDALGTLAERLAQRASAAAAPSRATAAALSAHLDVAAGYGVKFDSYEADGRMQVCYDGEAFRRVLALPARPEQRARAALALTRPECADPTATPAAHAQQDAWRAQVLDQVAVEALPGWLRNRVHLRRAGVWSALAFERQRTGAPEGPAAASRALAELAGVARSELPDADLSAYNDAAMRVAAVRWAVAAEPPAAAPAGARPSVVTVPGAPGETCVLLVDARHGAQAPLARRCTYGVVWAASARLNREGSALALAVQPLPAWRELWVFRRQGAGWAVDVLPPGAVSPGLGYAEFAGWVPGGRQMLVAREARDVAGGGRYRRTFEVVQIATLATERQVAEPAALPLFQRWQDASWQRQTLSLR